MRRLLIAAIFAGVLALLTACGSSGAGAPASSVQKWDAGTFEVTGCVQDNGMGLIATPGPEVTITNTSASVVTLSASLGGDPGLLWADKDNGQSGNPQVTLQPGESEGYTIGDDAANPMGDPCDQQIEITTGP